MSKDDPVEQLGKELAADHTIAKARGEAGDAPATEQEPAAEPAIEGREPVVIGDFSTFVEAREFADDPAGELGGPVKGDFAVVNGALCRFNGEHFDVILSSLVDEYSLPADHTEVFSRSLSDLERIVLEADFESGPLLGGLRDTILALFKARPKGWSEMSQMEQRDLAKQVEAQAKTLIRKVARVIAEGEEISVAGKLESFNCKGGFDLKISAPGDEDAVVQLFKMVGHEVVILSADSERFLDAAEPRTDPDEPGLPFADAGDEDEDEDGVERLEPADDDSDLALAGEMGDDPDLETGTADDNSELGAAVAEVVEAEEPAAGTGAAAIAAMNAAAAESETGLGDEPLPAEGPLPADVETAEIEPGDYEARSNPDDDFEEATEEELAAQAGRQPVEAKVSADYEGPKEPEAAVPGESWLNTSDDRLRYKHPNGKFYLSKPTEEALEEWRAQDAKPAAAEVFPADPES